MICLAECGKPQTAASFELTFRKAIRMANIDSTFDYWAMTPTQLRDECTAIAQAANSGVEVALRTEAGLLAIQWREAIAMPKDHGFEESRRNDEISGLKHRTIEILIKIRGR